MASAADPVTDTKLQPSESGNCHAMLFTVLVSK